MTERLHEKLKRIDDIESTISIVGFPSEYGYVLRIQKGMLPAREYQTFKREMEPVVNQLQQMYQLCAAIGQLDPGRYCNSDFIGFEKYNTFQGFDETLNEEVNQILLGLGFMVEKFWTPELQATIAPLLKDIPSDEWNVSQNMARIIANEVNAGIATSSQFVKWIDAASFEIDVQRALPYAHIVSKSTMRSLRTSLRKEVSEMLATDDWKRSKDDRFVLLKLPSAVQAILPPPLEADSWWDSYSRVQERKGR